MREALGSMAPTTVMTGNLTQWTMDVVQLVAPADATARSEAAKRFAKFGWALGGFVAGAALAAWATGSYGLRSLVAPPVVVGVITLVAWRRAPRTGDRPAEAPAGGHS
jgi:uncharacterized membrane protein YoaK (UPF0700 family)